MTQYNADNKKDFFIRNLLKGFIGLALLITVFIVVKKYFNVAEIQWLLHINESPKAVLSTFLFSELVFGLIPPEIFMIWSIHHGIFNTYAENIILLAVISYLSGVIGYWVGNKFSVTRLYKRIHNKFLYKYEDILKKFSAFILIVGALTPLPFSGMCMLAGSINYPFSHFLLITLSRFFRFGMYGYIVWEANKV
ncbi:MAG: VTT domain-containing protein [Cyclobacteriaceae bacterium]|nr:VTT domain-containing protein [Cyclobacteriaceae bacterium]